MRRFLRLLTLPLRWLAAWALALVVVFEEWGWEPLQRALGAIARWPVFAWIERRIAALPPYGALAVFALPSLGLLPVKLLALWLIGQGQATLGVVVIVAAKLAGTALVARLFLLTRPQLMQLAWFALLYARWTTYKDRLLVMVRASAAWRAARALKARMRRLARRLWRRGDFDDVARHEPAGAPVLPAATALPAPARGAQAGTLAAKGHTAAPPRSALRRVLIGALVGLIALVVGLPVLFSATFLAIQEASERQWLGRAPTHASIDVRSREPHALTLLDEGFDSLATRLRLIEQARESIELEFFIYEIDTASRLVTQALARKAREGVKVRLLVDFARPVFKLAPRYAGELAAAGVQVRYYNTAGLVRFFAANHRTHRKLLVVDRRAAIVGGRNIGDDYFDLSPRYNFLDSDLLIEGPVAAAIADSFELYWASDWVAHPAEVEATSGGAVASIATGSATAPANGGTLTATTDATGLLSPAGPALQRLSDELRQHAARPATTPCEDLHFVTDYPGSGVERRKVFQEITRLSQEATREILVESPYLVLRDDGLAVLQALSQRGVRLQFLTNSLRSTDAFYTVASLANALQRLQLPGLEVWAYQGEPLAGGARAPASPRWGVHAKRAVFDDHTVALGTYNIDPRSANLNAELMVVCRGNHELAAAVRASIHARRAQARAVVGTATPGGFDSLVDGADRESLFMMRAVAPLARWLDILM